MDFNAHEPSTYELQSLRDISLEDMLTKLSNEYYFKTSGGHKSFLPYPLEKRDDFPHDDE